MMPETTWNERFWSNPRSELKYIIVILRVGARENIPRLARGLYNPMNGGRCYGKDASRQRRWAVE